MEFICIFILFLIAVGIIGYFAGRWWASFPRAVIDGTGMCPKGMLFKDQYGGVWVTMKTIKLPGKVRLKRADPKGDISQIPENLT